MEPSRDIRSNLRRRGFTLIELLVSMTVLVLLVVLIVQLLNSATTITTTGNKHMDADAQARPLLDRMAIDFARMVKRKDIDYFVKNPGTTQAGNDQMAFFSEAPGYYPQMGVPSTQSGVSLVGFRLNSTTYNLERLGKGLSWNGVAAAETPIVFLPLTIAGTWPAATSMTADADYELFGPQVFRFEYYYVLKNGTFSDTPWDVAGGSTSINGFNDVAAIAVAIAVIDPKSRVLVSDAQLGALAALMNDFGNTMKPGDLATQWQGAINASTIPRAAASALRVYQRYFYLSAKAQ